MSTVYARVCVMTYEYFIHQLSKHVIVLLQRARERWDCDERRGRRLQVLTASGHGISEHSLS